MDSKPAPFVPPAPKPRTSPPSLVQMFRIVHRNPLELWGEPSYNEKWISIRTGVGGPLVIANDPGLIRHVLVDNARNYAMARVRQLVLRPILRDGLLTAEGQVWKRSRKAMAPVFTPRHIAGFAEPMLRRSLAFAERYERVDGTVDIARDMTMLTYDILAETLFSGEIAGDPSEFRSTSSARRNGCPASPACAAAAPCRSSAASCARRWRCASAGLPRNQTPCPRTS
jgi:cytochrome P450